MVELPMQLMKNSKLKADDFKMDKMKK